MTRGAVDKARAEADRTHSPQAVAAYTDALRAWADATGVHVRLPDGTWHNPPADRR